MLASDVNFSRSKINEIALLTTVTVDAAVQPSYEQQNDDLLGRSAPRITPIFRSVYQGGPSTR